MTVEAYFAINENLGEPPLHAVIWRFMRRWAFEDLLKARALWFSRLEVLQDEFEGKVPKANLLPPYDAVAEAMGAHLAHVSGIREAAGKAFEKRVNDEKPLNLINCWYLGDEPSDFMWLHYAPEKGDIAVRSRVSQVGTAIHHEGTQLEVFAWPITYIEHDNQAVTMRHFLAPFFVKGRSYEDEWEVRFLLHVHQPVDGGIHVAVRLEQLFDRVLVHSAGEAKLLDETKALLEGVGIHSPIEHGV